MMRHWDEITKEEEKDVKKKTEGQWVADRGCAKSSELMVSQVLT